MNIFWCNDKKLMTLHMTRFDGLTHSWKFAFLLIMCIDLNGLVSVYIQWYWLSSLSIPIHYYLIVALCIHCMNKMELMGKQTPTFTSSHILWLIWTSLVIKEGLKSLFWKGREAFYVYKVLVLCQMIQPDRWASNRTTLLLPS